MDEKGQKGSDDTLDLEESGGIKFTSAQKLAEVLQYHPSHSRHSSNKRSPPLFKKSFSDPNLLFGNMQDEEVQIKEFNAPQLQIEVENDNVMRGGISAGLGSGEQEISSL